MRWLPLALLAACTPPLPDLGIGAPVDAGTDIAYSTHAAPGVDVDAFAAGLALFEHEFTPPLLGPGYNDPGCTERLSCVACHGIPSVGGAGDYAHRSPEGTTRCEVDGGAVDLPPSTIFRRVPSLLFSGAMQAIHPTQANCGPGGVVVDDAPGIAAVFGQQLAVTTAETFAGGALFGEMGVTNSQEGGPPVAHPEVTDAQLALLGAFLVGIDLPPSLVDLNNPPSEFQSLCAPCHDLGRLGSDWCAHDMGPTFASSIANHNGSFTAWRTGPLLGISRRLDLPFLHDGRASTVAQAIEAHEVGDVAPFVAQFDALAPDRQAAIVAFVSGL
jgi:Di-haem oxidoreductase, putative peroxidase